MVPFALTVIGPDRPGLVAALARVVVAQEGNWLESRMSHLGGHFAGIVRVQVPEDRESGLRQDMASLAEEGILVTVARDTAPAGRTPQEPTMALDIVGNDRPGIVQQVTAVLAGLGVNVEALDTDCTAAPWSGEPIFEARLRIRLPQGVTPATLRADLERIAGELMVDFTLGLK